MNRTAEVKKERRRRQSDALDGTRKRLAVDEDKLDREKFVYRFANDADNRMHSLTVLDDWEVAPEASAGNAEKTSGGMAVRAGSKENGDALRSILVRKPRKYAEADEAARQRKIDEQERGLKEPTGQNTYAADGMNIRRE